MEGSWTVCGGFVEVLDISFKGAYTYIINGSYISLSRMVTPVGHQAHPYSLGLIH